MSATISDIEEDFNRILNKEGMVVDWFNFDFGPDWDKENNVKGQDPSGQNLDSQYVEGQHFDAAYDGDNMTAAGGVMPMGNNTGSVHPRMVTVRTINTAEVNPADIIPRAINPGPVNTGVVNPADITPAMEDLLPQPAAPLTTDQLYGMIVFHEQQAAILRGQLLDRLAEQQVQEPAPQPTQQQRAQVVAQAVDAGPAEDLPGLDRRARTKMTTAELRARERDLPRGLLKRKMQMQRAKRDSRARKAAATAAQQRQQPLPT